MKLTLASKEFLKEIEVRKYSPKTIRSYRNNLNLFLCYCAENAVEDTEDVTLGTVKGFAFFMSNLGRKGTYINSLLKAVKSFTSMMINASTSKEVLGEIISVS